MATHSFVERYLQYGSDDEAVENQLSKQLGKLNKEMLWILLANLGSQMEPDEVNDTTKKQMIELIIPRLNAGVGGLVLAGGNPADQELESSDSDDIWIFGKGKGKGKKGKGKGNGKKGKKGKGKGKGKKGKGRSWSRAIPTTPGSGRIWLMPFTRYRHVG
jgi:hypothetical protein